MSSVSYMCSVPSACALNAYISATSKLMNSLLNTLKVPSRIQLLGSIVAPTKCKKDMKEHCWIELMKSVSMLRNDDLRWNTYTLDSLESRSSQWRRMIQARMSLMSEFIFGLVIFFPTLVGTETIKIVGSVYNQFLIEKIFHFQYLWDSYSFFHQLHSNF